MIPPLVSTALGIWVMASPSVLDLSGRAATTCWILGPSVASVGLIAAFAVMRGVRFANIVLGFLLAGSPLFADYTAIGAANAIIVGLILVVISPLGSTTTADYGSGWGGLIGERSDSQA